MVHLLVLGEKWPELVRAAALPPRHGAGCRENNSSEFLQLGVAQVCRVVQFSQVSQPLVNVDNNLSLLQMEKMLLDILKYYLISQSFTNFSYKDELCDCHY